MWGGPGVYFPVEAHMPGDAERACHTTVAKDLLVKVLKVKSNSPIKADKTYPTRLLVDAAKGGD